MKGERLGLFNTWAATYDNSLSGEQNFPFAGYESILANILSTANVRPGMRVLDVGTGTGNLASAFVQKGCRVWACDYSLAMLERAEQKLPDVTLFQLDLLDGLDSLTQKFERIVSSYVLHEFDLATKLNILTRLCKDNLTENGFVIIGDIAFPDHATHDMARERYREVWDSSEHYWIAEETKDACEEVGLEFGYEQGSSCAAVLTFRAKP